jgi:hypothetical protein
MYGRSVLVLVSQSYTIVLQLACMKSFPLGNKNVNGYRLTGRHWVSHGKETALPSPFGGKNS